MRGDLTAKLLKGYGNTIKTQKTLTEAFKAVRVDVVPLLDGNYACKVYTRNRFIELTLDPDGLLDIIAVDIPVISGVTLEELTP